VKNLAFIFVIFALFLSGCGNKKQNEILNQSDLMQSAINSKKPVLAQNADINLLGENVTDAFQIRNNGTGFAINTNRHLREFNQQNWFLNELGQDPKIRARDNFANSFSYGYVQFMVAADTTKCLSVAPSGFLVLKDCKQDYESGDFETIFQLLPTTSGAIQIRSLLLKTNECLGTYYNPNVPIQERVGLIRCVLEFFVEIEPKLLFTFAPPLSEAKVVK